jgi:hypothetical protein
VAHRFDGASGQMTVGVIRRTTALPVIGRPRVAIPEDLARESVVTMLVADLPGVGNDVFDISAEVARDGGAWVTCEIKVDGEVVSGYEREYEGMWLAYYLTATLIVFVLAPVAFRSDVVELRTLGPDEVARRAGRSADDAGRD